MTSTCTADSGTCATCGHIRYHHVDPQGTAPAACLMCEAEDNWTGADHPYVPRPCGARLVSGDGSGSSARAVCERGHTATEATA